jgi:hypothetical protein
MPRLSRREQGACGALAVREQAPAGLPLRREQGRIYASRREQAGGQGRALREQGKSTRAGARRHEEGGLQSFFPAIENSKGDLGSREGSDGPFRPLVGFTRTLRRPVGTAPPESAPLSKS